MRSASSAARSGPSAGRILLVAGLLIIGAGIGIGALLAEHEPGTPETPGGYVAEPTLTWSPDETLFLDEATLPVEPTAEAVAVELRNAIDEGLVSAKGIGDGLERLDLELTSRSDENLLVTVEVGTVLAPRASSTQNMVVVREASIELVPDATETLELDVACAQMHDDQPSGKDSFKVQMLDPKADLLKLLRLDTFGDETFRVQQFAIWTITDNPPRGGYQGLGTTFDIYGTGPTSKELGRIKALFEDAGISTGHYRALS